ncbi:MAG: hypothetical protein HY327_00940 [Chloroflexi bacterium]|nr:hypothetical protein [Chloroflexota bacterium]
MAPDLRVNIFSNDPNANGYALEQVAVPSGESRFAIPGWNGAGGLFEPGTSEFQAGALYVVLNRTVEMWTELFGDAFKWQPGAATLPVTPRAGKDFNAYYDRTGLKFFFNDDKSTGQTIYTSESPEITAHECGHAILDARHPDYWDSLLAETAAFHEAFGDVSALMFTLSSPVVRQNILAENGGDLSKSNAATRLAEQLARGLSAAGFASAVTSPSALRDFVNTFTYSDPDALPGHGTAAQLTSESHNFARVFTAGFYDMLVGIYNQLRAGNPLRDAEDALVQARAEAGKIIAEGLDLAPKGDAPFRTIAVSMLKADEQFFAGKHGDAIRQAFLARKIIAANDADLVQQTQGRGNTVTAAKKMTTLMEPPVRLGRAGYRIGKEFSAQVADSLGLTEYNLVSELKKPDDSSVMEFRKERELEMRDERLGAINGAIVNVFDSATVLVDASKQVVSSSVLLAGDAHDQLIQDHLMKIVERKRIYIGDEGEAIDPNVLIERRQPYYLETDAEGKKRVRRGYYACC